MYMQLYVVFLAKRKRPVRGTNIYTHTCFVRSFSTFVLHFEFETVSLSLSVFVCLSVLSLFLSLPPNIRSPALLSLSLSLSLYIYINNTLSLVFWSWVFALDFTFFQFSPRPTTQKPQFGPSRRVPMSCFFVYQTSPLRQFAFLEQLSPCLMTTMMIMDSWDPDDFLICFQIQCLWV